MNIVYDYYKGPQSYLYLLYTFETHLVKIFLFFFKILYKSNHGRNKFYN